MKTLTAILSKKFADAIVIAFPELEGEDFPLEVTPATQGKFGHYQCNSAMRLVKPLKMPPRTIAEKIVESCDCSWSGGTMIDNLEVAGPGFINVTLDVKFLAVHVEKMLKGAHLGLDFPTDKQKIILDFSSPNIAKEMHVGHLRTTIIGDCLARLFEFLGHNVERVNHLGDWGTAFGMLIAHMKEIAPGVFSGDEEVDLLQLETWYKESKKRFDSDEEFKKCSQLEVVALQGGEAEALKAWKIICDISEKAYDEIYDILDVKLTPRGESFYNPMLPEVITDLESKGLIEISEGAKCVFLEGFVNREGDPLPLMVQKSDGGYNYDTTDMAAIRYRVEEQKGDRLIYVVDAGQAQHFAMIFQAAIKAGYVDPEKVRTDYVPFGVVLGPDGKKFRTRSGKVEKLVDLLYAAVDGAEKILEERDPNIGEAERKKIAKALGIGAIKYADLSCNRTGDYVFSYDRMLRFEGNTAAFLMYSYVRIAGIKRKIDIDFEAIKASTHIELTHPSEMALALHLLRFGEALADVEEELLPNRLSDYLYILAEKFNHFHRDCRVVGTPEQNPRLLLCEAVANVMKQGLHILGVETVERM